MSLRLALAVLLVGCAGDEPSEDSTADTLADFGLLDWDGATLTYADHVVEYELATPLFSDYAAKRRAIVLPDGESAAYVEGDKVLDFPEGTRLLKTFLLPADLRAPDQDLQIIETRVLTHGPDGWEADPWLWNAAGTEAELAPSGAAMAVDVIGLDGNTLEINYLVPQRNQCVDCHELKEGDERVFVPIGPKVRHLNRDFDYGAGPVNQLQHLADEGLLTALPAVETLETAVLADSLGAPSTLTPTELDAAARDYLDINCAHCHNPQGTEGISSQLFLHRGETVPFNFGVCKQPGSAGAGTGGLTFDIVPGDHSQSILWYRMDTIEPGAMMPDIGRSVAHADGIELIAAWIDAMTGSCD